MLLQGHRLLPAHRPAHPPAQPPGVSARSHSTAGPAAASSHGHRLAAISVHSATPIQLNKPKRNRRPPDRFTIVQAPRTRGSRRGAKTRSGLISNKYMLPKPRRFKGRNDSTELSTHFDAITEHFNTHKDVLDRANRLIAQHIKSGKGDLERKWRNKGKTAKGRMTEAIGEMNATNKILADRPHWQLLSGFGPGVGIDQVWRSSKSQKLSVVEAKGPGAKLGVSDRKGGQMSKPWVLSTAQGMSDDFGISKAIGKKGGLKGVPKVRGYVIGSTPTGKQAQKNWDKFTYN